jgi:phosphoserine phosphatase RsbU/P
MVELKKKNRLLKLLLFFQFLVFVIILVTDFNGLVGQDSLGSKELNSLQSKQFQLITEILYIVFSGLVFLYYNKSTEDRVLDVHSAIKTIGKSIFVLPIVYWIGFLISGFNAPEIIDREGLVFNSSPLSLLFTQALTAASIIAFTNIFLALKTLIFYKRKRYTSFFYNLLFYFIGIAALISAFSGAKFNWVLDELNIGLQFFLILIFISIIVIALRNSWVTYLKRKEKYLYFIVSIGFILIITLLLGQIVFGEDLVYIKVNSKFVAAIVTFSVITIVTYLGVTALSLLLQLPTAGVFDRKMREIQYLHRLSSTINSEPDFNKLVLMITNMANEVTEANATWLEVVDQTTKELYIASSKHLKSEEIRSIKLSVEEGLSGKICKIKKSYVINDVKNDEQFKYLKQWKDGIQSVIAVPLISSKNEIMGIIFCTKNFEYGFDFDDLAMLEAFSNQVVIALENTKLLQDSIQRERLEQELKIAREVQQKLIPQKIPFTEKTEIEAISYTASEVGGDYFDFFYDLSSKLNLIIADVSGKGTSAAFYMAELKGVVKSAAKVYKNAKDILYHCNQVLYEQLEKKSFITASLLQIDEEKGTVKLYRAGHSAFLYYKADTDEMIEYTPKGLGLGISNEKMFNPLLEEKELPYKENDIILMYTDGLDEARNIFNDEYGVEKIIKSLNKHKTLSAIDIKHAILDDVISFCGKAKMHDDMTLIIIKFKDIAKKAGK